MGKGNKKQMITNSDYVIIALLIIAKGEPLNNSYRLMRILEGQFEVADSKAILDIIKEHKYVDYEIIKGIHYYVLSKEGRNFLSKELEIRKNSLIELFPNQGESISNLVDAWRAVG